MIAGAVAAYLAHLLFLRGYPREAVAESDRRRAPFRALAVLGIFGIMIAGFWVAYQIQIGHRVAGRENPRSPEELSRRPAVARV